MKYPAIQLHKGKEFSIQRQHPWIFSGAIAKKDTDLKDGELVEVYTHKNEYLATGYYANGSIAIRIISFKKTEINEDFWVDKISRAFLYRQNLGILNEKTNVYRLFFGEGDGVPGLILDYYNGHVILQAHSFGVYKQKELIVKALQKILADSLISVYDKSAESLSKHFSTQSQNGFLFGNAEKQIVVKENGHLFEIDFINGQKTGFFIDQRENRQLLTEYCKGKNVLNTFSYTGGFSVYAAAQGAAHVDSVDVSESAIELCNRNMAINHLTNHTTYAADTFEFLKDKQNSYDLIVLDPPAFAKSRESKHNAVQAYKRLNTLAMKLIKPNGTIFTFSCSGVVDKFLFNNTITSAALECGRQIKVLKYLNQPSDHPVTPYFPEGEYLKGMVLWVE